jgi:lipopolysaccharide assembly outer membrane protein LptD (OstA)
VGGAAGFPRTALVILSLVVSVCLALPPESEAADAEPADDVEKEPWNISSQKTSAVRSDDGSRIISFVNDVVITHGELVATADLTRYVEGSRQAFLQGNVVMRQDSTVIRGPVATYDRDRRIARFPSGVLIERPSGTAVADAGIWWRDDDRCELRGRAVAADTSGTLDADAMTYELERRLFYAAGDVRLVDEESGVTVDAQYVQLDRAENLARATGDPHAVFSDEDGVPIEVFAREMIHEPNRNVTTALGEVRILRETLEAECDTADFYRAENRSVLRGSPILRDGPTEISGERIELTMLGPGERIVAVFGAAQISNRFLEGREQPVPAGEMAAGEAEAGEEWEEGREAEGKAEEPAEVPRVVALADSVTAAQKMVEEAFTAADSTSAAEALAEAVADSAAADSAAAIAAADTTAAGEEEEPLPEWLQIPGERLPTANLLFGDEVVLFFVQDELTRVEVRNHARSKFYPNENSGEFTEWNDVNGDTLYVWFTSSEVDSVTVLGAGSGEYRMPLVGEELGLPAEKLLEIGKLVKYQAPRIRYDRANEIMHLDSGARVTYKSMVLTSGTIDFDANREIMTAGGDPAPVLLDRQDEIVGEDMYYHLPSRKGEIWGGRTQYENGYYSGRDVWKMGENELAVEDAVFTTCDLEEPHYHFACKSMKIYPDDKVVAKPVVLKVGHIPIFALPFYMASLRRDRHSGFLLPNLELGVDENRGRFIRNLGYYWAPNDYLDATATFDFYPQQERLVGYLNTRYHVRYQFSGRAGIKLNRDVPNNRKDTVVELEHRQIFSETMELTGSGRFLSSSSIYQDIDDAQRLDRDLRSHATLTKRFAGSNRSLRVELERRENLDTGERDETLPVIQFSQPSQPLTGRRESGDEVERGEPGWLDEVYYNLDTRFVNLRSTDADENTEQNTGAKVDLSLRTTRDAFRYLNLSPALNTEAAWIDEDSRGDPNAFRGTFNSSLSANTRIYGTFLRPVGPALGFRHVVEPQVSWSWAPDFEQYFYTDENGVERDLFVSFGGIGGTQRKTNRMNFSLRNLLQTKVLQGGQEKRYDFLTLRNSISYDFLAEERGGRPFTNLSSSLNVLSSAPINQSWSVTHDPYSWNLLSSSITTRVRISSRMLREWVSRGEAKPEGGEGMETAVPGEEGAGGDEFGGVTPTEGPLSQGVSIGGGEWQFDASHSFQRGSSGDHSSRLVFNSTWSPTARWRVTFNTQYDLNTGKNTSQQWSVHRDIHCWELSFDRRYLGGEWQYYFRINVKDLPDIKAERGDRFQGSQTGGFGGLPGF